MCGCVFFPCLEFFYHILFSVLTCFGFTPTCSFLYCWSNFVDKVSKKVKITEAMFRSD